jgi:GT2 family glycosyltransferase
MSFSFSPYTKNHVDRNYLPFYFFICLFVFLCIKGGLWGYIGAHPICILPGTTPQNSFLLPAGGFIALFSITWVISLLLFFFFPRQITQKKSILLILGISIVCRIVLIPHEPSDDVNRYLWEGKLIHEKISPYRFAPDDSTLLHLTKDDPFHASINHPDLPAAYPPFILYIFSLVGLILYSPYSIKLIIIIFDMGTVFLLLRLLQQRSLDLRWSLLYALNPVVLYAFSAHAHFDAIQNFFIVGSLLWFEKKSWLLMFVFAGLAVQSKYVAVVIIPFLVNRNNYKFAVLALITAIVPFLFVPDTGVNDFFFSLQKFGEEYAFNGPIHGLFRAAFGEIQPATMICKVLLGLLLIFGIVYFHPGANRRFKNDPISGILFSIGSVLLLMPTVHFWYITWIIPLLPFRPSRAWLLLCASVSFYFVSTGNFYQTGVWDLPVWAQCVEWVPFFILLLREGYLFFQRGSSFFNIKPLQTISVIIPTKNEEKNIEDCIQNIRTDDNVSEIIVVDGGSDDNTIAIAEQAGATVIEHHAAPGQGGGRGGQIRRGILSATGDIIAVVHADVRALYPIFSGILNILQKNPTIIGGAVGGVFDDADWRLKIVEWLNDFRALFFSISFGDQIQFFRRQPIVENDLFPNIPLMEDVEFSIRLNHSGQQVFLFGNALISNRRWKTLGFQNAFAVMKRMAIFLWKRRFYKPDTLAMYHNYYVKNTGCEFGFRKTDIK